MRDALRNQSKFWYSLYQGKEPVLKNGFDTGQTREKYSEPIQASARISSATGESEVELFGASVKYDRIISTVQNLPIDEYSRLWIDCEPDEKRQNFDYKVKRVAKGLNQHLWAIEKVVSNGNQTN